MSSVTALIPRPDAVSAEIPDSLLVEACRCYLQGEKADVIAVALKMDTQAFYRMVKTPQWKALQTAFRDEVVEHLGGRLTRIESTVLDKIEDQLHNGITRYTMMGEAYQAQLSPKEVIAIAAFVQANQAHLHKLKQSETPGRKEFKAEEKMKELERFAKARLVDANANL